MTSEEIRIAKATSRSAGASAIKNGTIRAVVPLFVEKNVDNRKTILDFGAGKGATSTKYLLSNGFDVAAYDLWCGEGDELLDKYALDRQYDVVFASNVINVQSSMEMLRETLTQFIRQLNMEVSLFAIILVALGRWMWWQMILPELLKKCLEM